MTIKLRQPPRDETGGVRDVKHSDGDGHYLFWSEDSPGWAQVITVGTLASVTEYEEALPQYKVVEICVASPLYPECPAYAVMLHVGSVPKIYTKTCRGDISVSYETVAP